MLKGKQAEWSAALGGDDASASALWDAVGQLDTPAPVDTEAAWREFEQRLDAAPAQATSRRNWRYYIAAVAAAILLLIALNLASGDDAAIERYANSSTGIEHVTLQDESIVALAPGSSLEFSYGEVERRASLRGEASFAVRASETQPFYVDGPDFELVVVGTEFKVVAAKSSTIAVAEGHVRLRGNRESEWIDLYAGDHAQVEDQLARKLDSRPAVELKFENALLSEVAQRLSDAGVLKLVVPSYLAACSVTADFSQASALEMTESLAVLFGADLKRRGEVYELVGGSCQ